MPRLALLSPDANATTSITQTITQALSNFEIVDYALNPGKAKAGILLINAADGPTSVAADQLIAMRQSETPNVFAFVFNTTAVRDRELRELVKAETKNLLAKYGYWGNGFKVFSDDDLPPFADFVSAHINDTAQSLFTLPTFTCHFCSAVQNREFKVCPACQKKQKEGLLNKIFG